MVDHRSKDGPVRNAPASVGTRQRVRRSWPVVAVVAGVGGVLAWLGWAATRPDLPDQDRDPT